MEMPPQEAVRVERLAGVIRPTAQDVVATTLRRAIVAGEFPGGTPLVLSELAEQMGVSTTPVREAVRRLASEGLVDIVSFRSAMVHMPTDDEVNEVYRLRLLLEPMAMSMSVERISKAELDNADKIRHQMESTSDVGDWVVLNHDFHGVLADGAHSPILASLLATLRDAASIIVGMSIRAEPAQMTDGNRDHAAIMDAFRVGDAEQVVKLTELHLNSTITAMQPSITADATADR